MKPTAEVLSYIDYTSGQLNKELNCEAYYNIFSQSRTFGTSYNTSLRLRNTLYARQIVNTNTKILWFQFWFAFIFICRFNVFGVVWVPSKVQKISSSGDLKLVFQISEEEALGRLISINQIICGFFAVPTGDYIENRMLHIAAQYANSRWSWRQSSENFWLMLTVRYLYLPFLVHMYYI